MVMVVVVVVVGLVGQNDEGFFQVCSQQPAPIKTLLTLTGT